MMVSAASLNLHPAGPPSEPGTAIAGAAVAACLGRYADCLRAIVLTGSLARDEATFVREGSTWNAAGDAEFIVIFQDRRPLPSGKDEAQLKRDIEARLLACGVRCSISISSAHEAYLRSLRPHIFAYELRACGKVIWGEPGILESIPAFPASLIPREDAWRLLSNRIAEQCEIVSAVASRSEFLPRELQYASVKLYLDMATSFSVFAGVYAPTYGQRARNISGLAETRATAVPCPMALAEFARNVETCTEWKLSGASPRIGWQFWEQAVEAARTLWRWELSVLTGETGTGAESDTALIQQWMSQQPVAQRLRGWFYVLRSCGWYRSWRNWPRWVSMARRASPRYWIYAAASSLFFALPTLVAAESANEPLEYDFTNGLPVHGTGAGPNPAKADWRGIAADVAWNYHAFVEATRA